MTGIAKYYSKPNENYPNRKLPRIIHHRPYVNLSETEQVLLMDTIKHHTEPERDR